nr:hypothetical protein [Tanacetum cinerariifolium]
MIFYTNLQQQVLNLEEAKIAQAKEIAKLKKRVKKLEKRRKSRPSGLRRLKKAGSSKQVKSSEEKDCLGAQEDASKQVRSIEDIDQDAEISLVDEAQWMMHDADMFGVDDLKGNEVFVDEREKIVKKKRQGQGFSGNVTSLFETMIVNAQEEVGEGSSLHTDSHLTPTDTQPSSSKP